MSARRRQRRQRPPPRAAATAELREATDALAMLDPMVQGLEARAYNAAERNRLNSDWSVSHLDSNEEIRYALRMLRAASRNLERNNDLYRKWLGLVVNNVVHNGFELQSTPRSSSGNIDRSAARQIERDFGAWAAGKVSLDGRRDLVQEMRLWARTIPRDGEIVIRRHLREEPRIETLEGDYLPLELHSPRENTVLGVALDADRRPTGYWLSNTHPGSQFGSGWSRTAVTLHSADDVIHAFVPERPGQVRGVPWGSAAFDDLLMLHGYKVAELAAARIAAARPVAIETEIGQDAKYEGDGKDAKQRIEFDGGPGGMTVLPPGKHLVPIGSDHPKANYGPYVTELKRDIAAGLGSSYHSLNSDLSGANYSSLRHGRADELRHYEGLQGFIASDVLSRIFGWWLDWYLVSGRTALPMSRRDKFFEHRWEPPKFQPLDPQKEAEGIRAELELGLTTRTIEAQKRGHVFRELVDQRAEEDAYLREKKVELEQPKAAAPAPAPAAKPDPKEPEPEKDDE